MAPSRLIAGALALMMIAGTAVCLASLHSHESLSKPSVKTGIGLLLKGDHNLVKTQTVLLPETVLGSQSTNLSVAFLLGLPSDTTFGRRYYPFPDGRDIALTVVLMGSDRSSIHNPLGCMAAQNWVVDKDEKISVPMDRPTKYDLPVERITMHTLQRLPNGQSVRLSGIYAYWFVSDEEVTSNLLGLMSSIAKTLTHKGTVERWAYVSLFCPCIPGEEAVSFQRIQEFIQAATPEFQLLPAAVSSQNSALHLSQNLR
jgi:hypothetical protein